jgi:acetyltransferase-like isoleucine patch superfamily enzyme
MDIIVGEKSVIGANSLVNRNVEANTIVGGVPAKIIRKDFV